jgi:hypothetical protein
LLEARHRHNSARLLNVFVDVDYPLSSREVNLDARGTNNAGFVMRKGVPAPPALLGAGTPELRVYSTIAW